MKILFLPKYSSKGASSRYRILQYLPHFREAGIECDCAPLFDNDYIDRLYSGKPHNRFQLAGNFIRRMRWLMRSGGYDLVYLEKDALPYFPYWIEKIFLSNCKRLIIDLDDAVYLNYTRHSSTVVRELVGKKFNRLLSRADAVVTGGPILTEYAQQFNTRVVEFPTSVDLTAYPSISHAVSGAWPERLSRGNFVIGWIGSPVTSKYLVLILEPLSLFLKAHPDTRLKLIGFDERLKDALAMVSSQVEVIEWTETTEAMELDSITVGIMPIDQDDLFAAGKCGLKLIQYMACGKPTISTPIKASLKINQSGSNLFATTSGEWLSALERCYKDFNEGLAGNVTNRKIAEENYSVQAQLKNYLAIFRSVGSSGTASAE